MVRNAQKTLLPSTILVIEDNAINRELVSDVLTLAGFSVLEAENAEAGLEIARTALPALILMDIALPELDGLEATALLKQDPHTAAIPVVALTAHAMQRDAARARRAGCVGYITKPVDTRTLGKQIQGFIVPSRPPKPSSL